LHQHTHPASRKNSALRVSVLFCNIIGTGGTVAEAKADFENSVNEVKEMYKEMKQPLPEELRDIEFEYKWDIDRQAIEIVPQAVGQFVLLV